MMPPGPMPPADSGEDRKQASGSSFYLAMRLLPRARREAMFAVYGYCRRVDDIADDVGGDAAGRLAALNLWRRDIDALYDGKDGGRLANLAGPVRDFGLRREDFHAVADGMEMDIQGWSLAPDLATLDLYCDRVASAVGRLSVRIFGMDAGDGDALSHHLGRALQLTNILRDVDEDRDMGRLYLPREMLRAAGIKATDAAAVLADPHIDQACRALAAKAREHYACADAIMAGKPAAQVRAPRIMSAVYGLKLDKLEARGWTPPRAPLDLGKAELIWAVVRRGFGS